MTGPSGNPFEPPSSDASLPLKIDPDDAGRVNSVSFRITLDDLKHAVGRGLSPLAIVGFVVLLIMGGIILISMLKVREAGLSAEAIRIIAFALLPFLAILGAIVVISLRQSAHSSAEAPFRTTVTLDASELAIREEGVAELRRSWPSVSGVDIDRHLIRFEFLVYNASTGRFVPHPGQIVPLRAFESAADIASFLKAVQGFVEASERLDVSK